MANKTDTHRNRERKGEAGSKRKTMSERKIEKKEPTLVEENIKKDILKFALQNAVLHNGKANPKAVLGKILANNQSVRKDKDAISSVLKECENITSKINRMDIDEQKKKLEEIAPELLEKKERKKELPELPNAKDGRVVTRIPPEPSKYNHIGHALSFLINYLYAKKYHGKCVLRFEDTNPNKCKQEYVDAMKEDVLDYLDIRPDKIVFVSDDLPKLYEYAEGLIKKGRAYVCSCSRNKMQELRRRGVACECRSKSVEQNLKEWKDMLNKKFKEGERVLRLKGDMQSKNYVMRDPVIFRISYEKHYRQGTKYCVYPLYDFENSVEEELCGITHILRSAEFGKMRIELQNYIKDLLGFKKQTVVQYGRFNILGAVTQGREIRQMIEEGKIKNWDDPSLVTLRALKRRGIQKETYYELAKTVGLSPTPTNIDWRVIASIDRKILDPKARRFFFIDNPKKIIIENAPEREVKIKVHPEHEELGYRTFKTGKEFFITMKDFESFENNKLYRLMECLNFKKQGNKFIFESIKHSEFKKSGSKIIHWLPVSDNIISVKVFTPEHKYIEGLGEESIKKIKIGEVVQFERFGFVRLDHKEKDKRGRETFIFWFTHK